MNSVLIIDDDPIHLEVATALLESIGAVQVRSATSGADARTALVDDGPFNLLLLDLNMPDYDGIEFLAHLRKIDFTATIVVNSAAHAAVRNSAVQLAKAYGLNIAAALEKPLTLHKLSSALAHVPVEQGA